MRTVLVIGFGNPGRRDDGLGPALAHWLEPQALPGVTVDADYQLTVEDAEALARHEVVVFADASVSGSAPFYFRRVTAQGAPGFSSHGVEPGEVLALAQALFGATPDAYVLGIRGYEFDTFDEGLSVSARRNLDRAEAFLERVVREGNFDGAQCGDPGVPAAARGAPALS